MDDKKEDECGSPPFKKSKFSADDDSVCNTEDNIVIAGSNIFAESSFGIEEYVSQGEGIGGILKQRYSDFIVREIEKNGNIVQIQNLEHADKKEDEVEQVTTENEKIECPLSAEDVEKIEKLCMKIRAGKTCDNDVVLLHAGDNKEHRKLIHLFVKEKYPTLDSETTQYQNEEKFVKIFRKSAQNRRNKRKEKNKNRYCHFVLYKENRDTMSAINLIARLLHIKPSAISYAGTKDKRAITSQKVCVSNVDAMQISSLNKLVKNIAIGNFEYKDCALKLGDLGGNHFSIVIRNVSPDASEASVSTLIHSLNKNGFINYFGMQRFGTGGVPTFEIGKEILCSNWEAAIKLILRPRVGEDSIICKAKEYWMKTNDSKTAYEMIKKRRSIEEQVLNVLASHGENSFYNAFQKIARNTRLMYIHSYQSYIWNKIVSKRVQMFGIKPVVGDLVVDKQETKESAQEQMDFESMTRCKVKAITSDDLTNGRYTASDVVIPLPGYDVIYPRYSDEDWYVEMLSKDGFSKDIMNHRIKEYSLSGAYRFMIVKPGSMRFSLADYDDHCIPLLPSDIDLINGKVVPDTSTGKCKALILEFTLPPSSYATMVIREITKLDTSTHKNIELNIQKLSP